MMQSIILCDHVTERDVIGQCDLIVERAVIGQYDLIVERDVISLCDHVTERAVTECEGVNLFFTFFLKKIYLMT